MQSCKWLKEIFSLKQYLLKKEENFDYLIQCPKIELKSHTSGWLFHVDHIGLGYFKLRHFIRLTFQDQALSGSCHFRLDGLDHFMLGSFQVESHS